MVLLFSCKKEEPPAPVVPQPIDYTVLPAITQVGANTFGCKVNGQVWVPRIPPEDAGFSSSRIASLTEADGLGNGSITCSMRIPELSNWFWISFGPTFFRTGTYYSSECFVLFYSDSDDPYIISSSDSSANWINISHLDPVKNIMAGTFKFLLVNSYEPYDTIRIEEGRFDMRYIPY